MHTIGKFNLAAAAAAVALAAPAVADTTVIHAGSVIRSADARPSGPATITVTDGRIVSIVDGTQPAPTGAEVVELADATVLPGLIDLHVHLTGDPSGDWWRETVDTSAWGALVGAKNARLTAKAGFTTVRDVGGEATAVVALKQAIEAGYLPGPRMLVAGQALSTVGGHGDVHGFRPEVMEALEGDNVCTGAAECAATVRKTIRDGADLIKFHATGGVLSQGDKSLGQAFTDAEMEGIISTAHDLGVKVASHAHADQGIRAAVRAGVDTLEHGTFTSAATAREMKTRGTVLVPTLLAFKGIGEKLGQNFYTPAVETKIRMTLDHIGEGCRNARAAGVTVAFGTDSGVTAHGRNAEEFALLEDKCGMSAREALASATTVAAKVIDMEGQIGRIEPG
jgi:imidazolonepropionase-like amidohydrolase